MGRGGHGHTQLWNSFLYHHDDDSFLFSHMRIFVKCVLSAQACERHTSHSDSQTKNNQIWCLFAPVVVTSK